MDIQPAPGPVGRVTVTASGQIDMATAPQLADALAQAQRGGVAEIVVDLSAVEFLDSVGIGVLADAGHHATQAGARLYLYGARGWIAQLLEITGMAAYLPAPPDRPAGP